MEEITLQEHSGIRETEGELGKLVFHMVKEEKEARRSMDEPAYFCPVLMQQLAQWDAVQKLCPYTTQLESLMAALL